MPEQLIELLPPLLCRGNGVFAGRKIKKGEALEFSPVIPIPEKEWRRVSQTVLRFYGYAWGEEGKDAALALGIGSLFCHFARDPSVHDVNDLKGMVTGFYAARDIEPGEEITVYRRQPGQPDQPGQQGPGLESPERSCPNRRQETKLLTVQSSPRKGRGVYARRSIAPGERIERARVLFVPAGEWNYLKDTVISNYWFSFGAAREHVAIALGYGSLYNHSYTPNAVYEVKENEMDVMFKALRKIEPGEEILINYNRDPGDRAPLWFDVLP